MITLKVYFHSSGFDLFVEPIPSEHFNTDAQHLLYLLPPIHNSRHLHHVRTLNPVFP